MSTLSEAGLASFLEFRYGDDRRCTRINCAAQRPNGEPGCALVEKVSDEEGATFMGRLILHAFNEDDPDLLPVEILAGKEDNTYGDGRCIHAARMAAWTLGLLCDSGEMNAGKVHEVLDWLVENGFGKSASINQEIPDTGALVYVRERN